MFSFKLLEKLLVAQPVQSSRLFIETEGS